MKLQKRLGRIYNGKEYYKYLVVLPEEELKIAGFKEGDELHLRTESGKLTLTKSKY